MNRVQMVRKMTSKVRVLTGMVAFALCVAMCSVSLSFVSLADRQGQITASAAKIRKEASTNSEQVGRVEKDTKVTVLGEKQGGDGHTWYEVSVDGVTGYIRDDLMTADEAPVEVTKVNPTSAKVAGDGKVRVRANASTSSDTVASIPAATALTVTGEATGSDGKTWYEVNCTVNGEEIDGFIRSDYVELEEDLTSAEEPEDPNTPVAPPEEEPKEEAPYYVKEQEGVWYLVKNNIDEEDTGWAIQNLFDGIEKNAAAYEASLKTVSGQKVVIIIFAILLVAAIAAIGYLLFKVRDLSDSAYYDDEEEEEELRRREENKNKSRNMVMHTIGEDVPAATASRSVAPQGRPVAPQGRPVAPQGRPVAPQGRPVAPQGSSTAPQGRPVAPQGSPAASQGRPVTPQGRPVTPQGRPVAPQGRPVASQGRPVAPQERPVAPQGRPAAPQGRPVAPQGRPAAPQGGKTGWQAKNFMADDDEFDFEFLSQDNE